MGTRIARQRAAVLRRLAADLVARANGGDPPGCERLADVFEALCIGARAQVDSDRTRTLRVRVPRSDVPRRAVAIQSIRAWRLCRVDDAEKAELTLMNVGTSDARGAKRSTRGRVGVLCGVWDDA